MKDKHPKYLMLNETRATVFKYLRTLFDPEVMESFDDEAEQEVDAENLKKFGMKHASFNNKDRK